MQEMYQTSDYADRNPTWHEEDSPWKASQIEAIIRRNGLSFETLCEVGCGTGEILLNLNRSFPGKRLTGYEISPHAYERAKRKEQDGVSFRFGDLLEQEDARFDIVVVADVIEHVEDYIAFTKKLKRFGRHTIFHIPLDLSVQSILRSWPIIGLRSNVGHLHYFYKETALATLRDCGYTVVDHCYTPSRLELPNQALSSRIMRLPRRALHAVNADFAVRLLGGYSLLVLCE